MLVKVPEKKKHKSVSKFQLACGDGRACQMRGIAVARGYSCCAPHSSNVRLPYCLPALGCV